VTLFQAFQLDNNIAPTTVSGSIKEDMFSKNSKAYGYMAVSMPA
jgi:hypothetical protein